MSDQLEQKIEALSQENRALRDRLQRAEKDLGRARAGNALLVEELAQEAALNTQMSGQIVELEKENANLTVQINDPQNMRNNANVLGAYGYGMGQGTKK